MAGVERAAAAGAEALERGALEAVVAAVRVLEEDPNFNAGRGSTLTSEGTVELDAALMTSDLSFGAVGACPPVASAIELARKVLESNEHAFLVGEGALDLARRSGIEILGSEDLIVERALHIYKRLSEAPKTGTVGAVALDSQGRLAAATSTGGIAFKRPGRVGDTPLPGAGTYADAEFGAAASATGNGEQILRVLLTREAVERVGRGSSVSLAGAEALDLLGRRAPGDAGLILIDANGEVFAGRNTPYMPWAHCVPGDRPVTGT